MAPLVLDGPMTGAAFLAAYVEQVLAPSLAPGDVAAPPPPAGGVCFADRIAPLLRGDGQPRRASCRPCRHRSGGSGRRPDDRRHPRGHRRRRCLAPLSAARLARPQPIIRQEADDPISPKERRSGDRRGQQPFAKLKAPLCKATARPKTHYGPPSASSSPPSPSPNAPTTYATPAMALRRTKCSSPAPCSAFG
jgi:hypothetical protein